MRAVVLIPALNEANTVAAVVRAARSAAVGEVLVIDDGSDDATAAHAKAAGAKVLRLEQNLGKGGALLAGARQRSEELVILLDADLVGLRPAHVHALVRPLLHGEAEMTRGVFEGGRWMTSLAQRLMPVLNGQRALRREDLLAIEDVAESGYGVELAISEHARAANWRTVDVPLRGVSQVMKEEKLGAVRGASVRLRMYLSIFATLFRRTLSRRRG
jgi:glycosyltransferase involved in cell wall biosynthesis